MNICDLEQLRDKCTGCYACMNICPTDAIKMIPNHEGFYYPVVEHGLCNNCNKCVDVCTINKIVFNTKYPQEVYSCQSVDDRILIEATSGGFFPVVGRLIIEQGGRVYGAAYDDSMSVVHKMTPTVDGLREFSGSKYVQSRIELAFRSAKRDLKNGIPVLFSGTPCQIAGLRNYLGNHEYEKLFTLDVLCYGVPSEKLFHTSLREFEKEHKAKVVDYRFRDKHTNGWSHTTVITFVDGEGRLTKYERENYKDIPYYRMFARRDCFRESCYSCPFITQKRVSDITVGNFWGIEKLTGKYDTRKGVSMVVINTEKGKRLFDALDNYLAYERHSIEDALQSNGAFHTRAARGVYRDKVYIYLNSKGFVKMVQKYYTDNLVHKISRRLYALAFRLTRSGQK